MTAPILETPRLRIPRIGLGTWQLRGAEATKAVEGAIGLGYRHIDTAAMYGNEEAVGAGIRASGLRREEIFLTTKVWWTELAPDALRASAEASLERLGTPHADLILIHWPARGMNLAASLGALAKLQADGLTRAVGVSNFPPGLLKQALDLGIAPIAALQVECHVYLWQEPLAALCRQHGLAMTAYSPIAKAQVNDDPAMRRIAAKHGATPVQVALAWLMAQDNLVAIPKSGRPQGQRENLAAAALRLDADDMAAIAALPKDRRLVNPDFAPDWAG
ncbi:aldo/keto reductase [Roseomonas eburnea]|uniref:Aldo/keto reductase n=1 Tax=Neoroseomonas eburnea TaxID=1346889 RepID=A0A9X9XG67_9PROT|nr:aldo/keto reductase [Neoroseomonas eburnea]MBR0682703.1 aldo/keto reductase [Neoroseomonas eburnea]